MCLLPADNSPKTAVSTSFTVLRLGRAEELGVGIAAPSKNCGYTLRCTALYITNNTLHMSKIQ
jgi:hypothetical protein